MSGTSEIIDILMASTERATAGEIARQAGVDKKFAGGTLGRLATYGRASTALDGRNRYYWMNDTQRQRERLRRAMFSTEAMAALGDEAEQPVPPPPPPPAPPKPAASARPPEPVGVMVLAPAATLAADTAYIEEIARRAVFVDDVRMQRIARAYRATLLAVRTREDAGHDEVVA